MLNRCYTYMVACRDGSIYIGTTDNLLRRVEEHRKGLGARYVKAHGFKAVIYAREHLDRGSAMRWERYLKTSSRSEKIKTASNESVNTLNVLRRWGLERCFINPSILC